MLNARQQRFVAEYAIDLNATQAAIRAGYSEKTAYSQGARLSKHVEVRAALEQAHATARQVIAEQQQAAVASAQWIIEESVKLYVRCMEAEPVRDKLGHETGFYVFDSGGANRALDRLAKRHPEFRESVVIDNRQQTLLLPEGTTLEDLKRLREGFTTDHAHA